MNSSDHHFVNYSVNRLEDGTPVFRLDSGRYRNAVFYFDDVDVDENGKQANVSYTVVPYGWFDPKKGEVKPYDNLGWNKKKKFNNKKFLADTESVLYNCLEIEALALEEEEQNQKDKEHE